MDSGTCKDSTMEAAMTTVQAVTQLSQVDKLLCAVMNATSLDSLLTALQIRDAYLNRLDDSREREQEADDLDTTSLPTFGTEADEPNDTHGVFSWDATRFLVQQSAGWALVKRDEWKA